MNEEDFKKIQDILESKELDRLVIPHWLDYRNGV